MGKHGGGRLVKTQIPLGPAPPTETENLRNGYWEGVFLTSIPEDSYEKQILSVTVL